MYTKLEIFIIFSKATSLKEFEQICDTFRWLIDNGWESQSMFLQAISHIFFRKLVNGD